MRTGAIVFIFLLLLFGAGLRLFYGQDEPTCHDDEVKVTDSAGQHCEAKPKDDAKVMAFPAKECVKDFRPNDATELRVPVFADGSLDMAHASLQGFDFKLVCGVVKK